MSQVLEDHGHKVIVGCGSGVSEKRLQKNTLVKTDLKIQIDNQKKIHNIEELFLIKNIVTNGIYCNCRKSCFKNVLVQFLEKFAIIDGILIKFVNKILSNIIL